MVRIIPSFWNLSSSFQLSNFLQGILLFALATFAPLAVGACPDLTPYYQQNNADWAALEQSLSELMQQCLDSSEYFALLGAAHLNSGNIAESLEMLERALLQDPDNGAAQIDYAQALYLQGDLFAALELNRQLLRRDDLPSNLQSLLQDRQRSWSKLTRQRQLQLDLLAGYDNNLNSAPDPSQITLTLSGEPVVLALNPDFRPVGGPYLNFRFAGRYRQLSPEHQHNWLVDARGRLSDDTESDLLQLDTRYGFVRPGRRHSWQLNAAMTHLFFGGSPLYSVTESSTRYMPESSMSCKPYYGLAIQHQLFHNNSRLNAIESKASAGLNCPYVTSWGPQQLTFEAGLLENAAIKKGRPGGGRGGWQFNASWQFPMATGELVSQISHTHLDDRDGYNPILADGADRWLDRSYFLLQYRRGLSKRTALMVNLFHQHQRSNIDLFKSVDTSVEVGMSLAF